MSFARTHDPETSHAAARTVKVSTVQQLREIIIYLLGVHSAMSDELLLRHVRAHYKPRVCPSSLRTRRRELVDEGIVRAVAGKRGTTQAGRSCLLWELTPEQRLF